MIKNEREYKITRAQAEQFERALESLRHAPIADDVHPKIRAIEAAALRSQLEDLRRELADYDSLKAGERQSLPVDTLDELPQALIQARIASDMSQEELGERLGVPKQVIQRYEASDYASASLTRLREVAAALGVNFRGHASVLTKLPSVKQIFKRLAAAGVDREFILDRVLPSALTSQLEDAEGEPERALILRMLDKINGVFGWAASDIFDDAPLPYREAALSAGFKLPRNAANRRTPAYAVYAHRLASIALKASSHLEPKPIDPDPKRIRQRLLEEYGAVDLEPALRWAWNLGIPVLPLTDSAAFYGACWRMSGRNVIILKQNTKFVARWLNDLLHEVYHASVAPDLPERRVVDLDPLERRGDDEEAFANDFAAEVVLDGRPEDLAQMCVQEASGNTAFLKKAVVKVAERESVPADALANYIAYVLSAQENRQNWWPTAARLQRSEPDPWWICRDIFFEFARFDVLDESERDLLTRALTEAPIE